VVGRSENYVFEDYNPLIAFKARVVSYALGAYKVYIEMMIVLTSERGSLDW